MWSSSTLIHDREKLRRARHTCRLRGVRTDRCHLSSSQSLTHPLTTALCENVLLLAYDGLRVARVS